MSTPVMRGLIFLLVHRDEPMCIISGAAAIDFNTLIWLHDSLRGLLMIHRKTGQARNYADEQDMLE